MAVDFRLRPAPLANLYFISAVLFDWVCVPLLDSLARTNEPYL